MRKVSLYRVKLLFSYDWELFSGQTRMGETNRHGDAVFLVEAGDGSMAMEIATRQLQQGSLVKTISAPDSYMVSNEAIHKSKIYDITVEALELVYVGTFIPANEAPAAKEGELHAEFRQELVQR